MKLGTEYLADAAKFERLASSEADPNAKEQLVKQATAYRKLAENRAKSLGIAIPPDPPQAV